MHVGRGGRNRNRRVSGGGQPGDGATLDGRGLHVAGHHTAYHLQSGGWQGYPKSFNNCAVCNYWGGAVKLTHLVSESPLILQAQRGNVCFKADPGKAKTNRRAPPAISGRHGGIDVNSVGRGFSSCVLLAFLWRGHGL